MTKLKLGLISAIAVGAIVTPFLIQHQALVKQREENQSLRQQAKQMADLETENNRLSNVVARTSSAQPTTDDQLRELLRLRGEVSLLRKQANEAEGLREENRRLRTASAQQRPPASDVSNAPVTTDQLLPAEAIKFINTDLRQVLMIYGELSRAQLDIEETLKSLPVLIHFTNTDAVTRTEAIRLLDNTLLEQAGIVVTHPETNRVMMRLRR